MTQRDRLLIIKAAHTAIWIFFNVVILYLFFAVVTGKIDKWVWIGLSLFLLEGIVLLIFKNTCPLTIMARRYSISREHNFDIFLPEWLARYNKLIYSCFLAVILLVLIYRLVLR